MKTVVYCLFSVVILQIIASSVSLLCTPECKGIAPGTVIADPLNCLQYYVCLEDHKPIDTPFTCPEGTSFDAQSPDISLDDPCKGPPTCQNKCRHPACHTDCEAVQADFNYLANVKGDCSKYNVCQIATEIPCNPETPYFDYANQKCIAEDYVCCDVCIPYCDKAFTEIRDPKSCDKFYFCAAKGEIDTSTVEPISCPDGQIFNEEKGRCAVPDDPEGKLAACDPPCKEDQTR